MLIIIKRILVVKRIKWWLSIVRFIGDVEGLIDDMNLFGFYRVIVIEVRYRCRLIKRKGDSIYFIIVYNVLRSVYGVWVIGE